MDKLSLSQDNKHLSQDMIQVEDQPYQPFNITKFYAKHGITGIEDNKNVTQNEAKEEYKKITNVENHTGFAYFFLEYCVVSHPTLGSINIKESAYKWQIKAAIEFLKYKRIISLKSRQVAFSTTVGAYCLWRALFFDSQRIAVISKNQSDSITFLERVKFMYDKLPLWLRQETSEFAKTYVTFAHNFSKISSLPNRGDPAQGESLSLLIADELASYQDSGAVLSAATPALAAGSLTPFTNKTLPSQFFVISTLPRKNITNNDYLRILHQAQDDPNSRYHLIDVETDDISFYRSKEWHMEMFDDLGPRGYKIEVLKQEVYETEHALIEGAILSAIKTKNPIRVDFINPEDVTPEGYYKDLNVFAKMSDGWDSTYKYLQGLWIWEDPQIGKEYVVTCLPKGEKVLTKNGLKNIENIHLNDILYSKDGKETKIINKQKTKVKNEKLFEISLNSIYQKTKFTGNHPIYASKSKLIREGKNTPRFWEHDFKFYKASEIEKNDWLLIPNIYKQEKTTKKEMINYFNKAKTSRYDFDLNENCILDEKIWFYIGLWLANGWTNKNGSISTSHHLKENYLIEYISEIFSKYNRSICYTEKPEENSLVIHLTSKHFNTFLKNTFGKYAKNKNLPEWVKFIPKKYKLQLIKGYLTGDGCIINKQTKKRNILRTNFVSISYKMLKDFQDILFSLGITSNLNLLRNEKKAEIKERIVNQQKAYSLNIETWESLKLLPMLNIPFSFPTPKHRKQISECYLSDNKEYIYVRVKDNKIIENYNGNVYNFETEDHTYMCDYISVHNCDVAGGESNDFCAFHVIDPENNNNQVAEYKGRINTEKYKEAVLAVTEYYNNAKLSIERNGLGINMCQYFGETINYENFYWHQKSKHVVQAGFPMVNPIRPNAIAFLENYITKGELTINSIRTLNELRNFGMTTKGKIAAISGNDDLVMALCQFVWLQEKGWAVSDSMSMNDMLFPEIKEDKNEPLVPKYFEDTFDMDERDLEALKFAKATGSAFDREDYLNK